MITDLRYHCHLGYSTVPSSPPMLDAAWQLCSGHVKGQSSGWPRGHGRKDANMACAVPANLLQCILMGNALHPAASFTFHWFTPWIRPSCMTLTMAHSTRERLPADKCGQLHHMYRCASGGPSQSPIKVAPALKIGAKVPR